MASQTKSSPLIALSEKVSMTPYLALDEIRVSGGSNPNVVSAVQYTALVHSIRHNGFLQPLLVRAHVGGGYEVVDGHHRLRAAKEVGLAGVPAVVVEASDSEAAIAMLSLNRLRGELDLSSVATILSALAEDGFPDLTLSGFNGGEISALLDSMGTSSDGISGLGEDAGAEEAVPPAESPKRFAVRCVFDNPEDRDLVRAVALRFGVTVESGLLAICKEQSQ